jgi:hypothetical protein
VTYSAGLKVLAVSPAGSLRLSYWHVSFVVLLRGSRISVFGGKACVCVLSGTLRRALHNLPKPNETSHYEEGHFILR